MHIGYSSFFQNLGGTRTDAEIYRDELALVDRVEAMGFDSVWAPEHHFTNYVMVPNTAQHLAWVAARTERVQLGAMINVLPWHDPVRICEAWSVLDHVSGGRAILGLGRGLGRVEFENFRAEMGESRGRFTEYTEAIVKALESGYIEYDGEYYKQPQAAIRPFPERSFAGRTYASAISPESIELMARLGVGILVIAQKPWETVIADLEGYRERFYEVNDFEAPAPILAVFVAVDESRDRAQEVFEHYMMAYSESAIDHYQFDDDRIADVPGYEYYAGLSHNIEKHGRDKFARFLSDLQVWGTPDDVTEQLIEYQRRCEAGGLIGVFNYGGMPAEVAERNLETFGAHVLPRLHRHPTKFGVGTATQPTAVASKLSPARVNW